MGMPAGEARGRVGGEADGLRFAMRQSFKPASAAYPNSPTLALNT